MDASAVYSKDQCPSQPISAPYQEACGHILWPAIISRPDVQFAIGILSQFTQNPADVHWTAVKRVMRYLYTTRDLWLTMGGRDPTIEGYVDANWASQPHRHSISGHAFRVGIGVVTWSSKKQDLVALSSTEAEYIAAALAAREICWLRTFGHELGILHGSPTTLHIDNQSTIALTKDNKFHARTKHIDVRYHFIREAVNAGHISVRYIPTEDNLADILTKPLTRFKFEYFRNLLGLRTA